MNLSEKINGNIWQIAQIIVLVATIVWAAAFLRKDVDDNTNWNERQDTQFETHEQRARETYVRKDVAQQRYDILIEKIDRLIEENR